MLTRCAGCGQRQLTTSCPASSHSSTRTTAGYAREDATKALSILEAAARRVSDDEHQAEVAGDHARLLECQRPDARMPQPGALTVTKD